MTEVELGDSVRLLLSYIIWSGYIAGCLWVCWQGFKALIEF